jgi:hypothetical protein
MPSDLHGSRGRSAISKWRVKQGKRDVYQHEKKGQCEDWMRKNPHPDNRLVAPNYNHK